MDIQLTIKAVPQSGRQSLVQDKNGQLKCFLKSAPEKNKANAELINILSKKLSLPTNNLTIIKGGTSRTKTIKIQSNLSLPEILQKLGIETQKPLA